PASCGVLPTASTNVTQTNGTPVRDNSASRSTNPCGVGIGFSVGGNAEYVIYRMAVAPAICAAPADCCGLVEPSVKHRSISSPVAGSRSASADIGDTYVNAFRAAAQTAIPNINGGSPTALLRYTLRTLSLLSNVATLNTSGTSVIAGILYVVGEW